jgi:hypothetical protein
MHLHSFEIFYLHLALAIVLLLLFLTTFISKLYDDFDKWFPKSIYLSNEKCLLKTGSPDQYFIEFNYPDLFGKNVLTKYLLNKEYLASLVIFTFIVLFIQLIVHSLLNLLIDIGHFPIERYFIITTIFIDLTVFIGSSICVLNYHVNVIKKDIMNIRNNNTNENDAKINLNRADAIDQVKDLMLEVTIARKSPEHRSKVNPELEE